MGVRVRKSVKIGGVRATVSKSGVSYSVGNKYGRVTKTARGQVVGTAKIPGSGFSYVQNLSGRKTSSGRPAATPKRAHAAVPARIENAARPTASRQVQPLDPSAAKTIPIYIPQQYRTGLPTGLAMKNRNPLGVWLGLPLITLGIYTYVWYYKIHREMAEFDRRRAVPIAGPMLVLLVLGWTVVAPLVSLYNTGNRIANAQRAAGLRPTCSAGIGLLLCFALGLVSLYYQSELNKVVDAYGDAPAGSEIALRS